jgi:hypothetical protein
MKIKQEHFDYLKKVIEPHDGQFHRSRYIEAGYTDKQYRWDLLRYALKQANPDQPSTHWVCDNLYSYMNDTHIDTALRKIIKPLDRSKK